MKSIVDLENLLVKPYIDTKDKAYAANIAPVETSPATSAHTAGTQIIYNGVLYDVTADIAANDVLATTGAGANIAAADDVSEQIRHVKQALTNEVEARATLGAHNLLENVATTTVYTDGNKTITFTVNSDKSVTVNGETGSSTNRGLVLNSSVPTKLGVKYILSGCPSGGSDNTYDVNAYSSDFAINVRDFGEGVEFTGNGDTITVRVWVKNSTAVNNKVFYPMLRLATDTDTTYQPYAMTNRQLTEARVEAQINKLGTLTVSSISAVEGNYAFTGSGYITIADVMTVGKKHLIKVAVRQLYMTPTTLSGEEGGTIKLNNKTPLQNINEVLGTSFTSFNFLNDTFKSAFRTYDDNNKRCVMTMSIGANGHYLQVYMPDGNGMFHVPNYVWWAWCE